MREKQLCYVCNSDNLVLDCQSCEVPTCTKCFLNHRCGVDGRSDLTITLDGHTAKGPSVGMIVQKLCGVVIGYLPLGVTISTSGAMKLVSGHRYSHEFACNLVELFRSPPIGARGAMAIVGYEGSTVSVAYSGAFRGDVSLREEFMAVARILQSKQ